MAKENIEGSAARAADRGRDQLFGGNLPDNSLNSIDVVEDVVRSFAAKVVEARTQYNADKITDAEAKQRVAALAQECADTLMGRNKDYPPTPWNSVEQLGRYIAGVIEGGAAPETAVADFMLYVASQLLQIMVQHESGALEDDAAQFRIDALIEDAVYALLGIPSMEMPEGDS